MNKQFPSLLSPYTLKNIDREGWKRIPEITNIESVADHSWSLSLLILEFTPEHLNLSKCLGLAIVHDIPEVVVGDITPHDGICKTEKHFRENRAAQKILSPKLYLLWKEYADETTMESKWVHLLDKIEMGIQAKIYQHLSDVQTQEFIISCNTAIKQYRQTQELPQHFLIFLQTIQILES